MPHHGPGFGPPRRGFGPPHRGFGPPPPPPPRRYGCCLPGCCTFVLGAFAIVGGLIALLCAIF